MSNSNITVRIDEDLDRAVASCDLTQDRAMLIQALREVQNVAAILYQRDEDSRKNLSIRFETKPRTGNQTPRTGNQ